MGPGCLEILFARSALADALGERLRGERLVVALTAQLLDRDVAGGDEDLGARDHARRAVLVPHPDVLEAQVDERVGRLRRHRALEPVAEVGRVRREDAVAEQAEHGLVLLLQQQLELCLVLVQVVEVAHNRQCSRALKASKVPRPGTSRPGATSRSGSRTKARSCRRGWGICRSFSWISASPKRRRSRSRVLGPWAGAAARSRPWPASTARSRS